MKNKNKMPVVDFESDKRIIEVHSHEELRAFMESLPDGPCNLSITIIREGENHGEEGK